jgi:hypothetical protein
MHMFTAAFRTRDLALFVFRKGEDGFKWLFAIFAEEFVTRHGDPQSKLREHILQRRRLGIAARKKSRQKAGPPASRPRHQATEVPRHRGTSAGTSQSQPAAHNPERPHVQPHHTAKNNATSRRIRDPILTKKSSCSREISTLAKPWLVH